MGGLWHSIRITLARLLRDRGFTATVVITLGVCLSANAVIFTIVNSVLLNPLRVPEPSAIMLMANQFPNAGLAVSDTSAPRNYYEQLEGVSAFVEQSLFGYSDQNITLGARAVRVRGLAATPSLFRLLRVDAFLGRTFTEDEGEIGNEDRVILSYGLWQQVYGGDPEAIGGELIMSGRPFTIVGVMPEDFSFFDAEVRFWIPLTFLPIDRLNAGNNIWYNIGRLASGATIEQAQAQVDAVNAEFLANAPRLRQAYIDAGYHTTVRPLADVLVGDLSRVIYLLWGAALVTLVIGAVNVANLSMVRLRARSSELATCIALGASRPRLACVLTAESLILAAAGGTLGLLLGFGALSLLGSIRFSRVLSLDGLALDPVVVTFVLGLSILTGAVIAAPPVRFLADANSSLELRGSTRGGTNGSSRGWLRRGLITAQVSLTFVLLMAAILFLLTLQNLTAADAGFTLDDRVTTAKLGLDSDRYRFAGGPESVMAFMTRALEEIRSLPGVVSAAATTAIPLDGGGGQTAVPEGHDFGAEEPVMAPTWARITPQFFAAIGTPLIAGRDLEDRDLSAESGVVIVDERLARQFWPGESAIGKRIFLPGIRGNGLEVHENTRWLTVVGVVSALRFRDLSGRERSAGVFFTPYTEANPRDFPRHFGLVLRSAGPADIEHGHVDINALRSRLAAIDPEVAIYDVQTMGDRMRASLARERMATRLAGAFAIVAVFLAAIGLYGVVSHSVLQRTREFGIRLALGSDPMDILKRVLRDVVGIVAIGVGAGLGAFQLLRPTLASQVYGVAGVEPVVVVLVGLGLGGISVLASAIPARRAWLLQPTAALK